MINPGNGSKWGIKRSGVNLAPDIHALIDNARSFIVVCGYNFSPYTNPTSIIPRLIARRQAGVNVLFIAPADMWGFGKKNHAANIQYLLNNRIGVILNSLNHSKWLVSDHGYYYGSLNFTAESMNRKIEVVSLCNVLGQSGVRSWMEDTKQELLSHAYQELHSFNTTKATASLGSTNRNRLRILQAALGRILRYNPEIEKVKSTLLNYEDVRLDIISTIDDYLPLISLEELNNCWSKVADSVTSLDELAFIGNEMVLKGESASIKSEIAFEYNEAHSLFIKRTEDLMKYIPQLMLKEKRQSSLMELTSAMEIRLRENLHDNVD